MELLKSFYKRFIEDETPRLAASTAFYTVFALAPLLLLMIAVAGFLQVQEKIELISQVHTLIGPEAAAAVQSIIAVVSKRTDLSSAVGISSALVWAFSASLLFSELRSALTRIFAPKYIEIPSRGLVGDLIEFLQTRLFSLVLVFTFTVVALVSLLISSTLAYMVRDHSIFFIRTINVMISFAVYFIFFAIAYKLVPKTRVSIRRATFGGLITSVLFVAGKELIGLYLGKTAFGSVYGAAGTLVVLLIWIYYSSLIVFAGAQLTVILVPQKARSWKWFSRSPEII